MANISNINDFFVVDSAGLKAVVGADLANGNGSPYVGTDFTVVGRDASSPVANLWLSNFTHKSYILISDNSSNFIIRDSAAGNRLTIDTNGNSTFAGNVGIGAAASDGNLHIRKTGVNTGITNVLMNANFADGSNGTGLSIGYRTDETTAVLAARTATGNIAFYSYNGGWSESMRIKNDGNVGIGVVTPANLLSAYNTSSTVLASLTIDGIAVNGTGGGNREFTTFTNASTTSFTGTDAVDQGYGYFDFGSGGFAANTTYTIHFKSVSVNGYLFQIVTTSSRDFFGGAVKNITKYPLPVSGELYSLTFTMDGTAAQYLGFGAVRDSGTMSLAISEVSVIQGKPDTETGSLVAYKGIVAESPAVSQYLTSTSGSQATLFIGRSIDTQAKITSGDVSANDLCFYVNNTRRLVIENGGDVGIGTDSPDATLHVDASGGGVLRISRLAASTTNYMQFENDGTNGTIRTEGATIFRAGGSAERMVIDSSGNVKLAITNATSSTTIGKDAGGMWMETAGSTNALSDMRFQARASGAGSYSAIKIKPSNQTLEFLTSNAVRMLINSVGNVQILGIGNKNKGNLQLGPQTTGSKWSVLTGSHYNATSGSGNGSGSAGVMMIGVNAENGENHLVIGGAIYEANAATDIQFWTHTTDTSTAGGTERMRVSSVGTLDVKGQNNNVNGMAAIIARLGSNCDNTTSYAFIAETGNANRCFIYGNGNIVNTNNSYGALSDERLKENIIDATPKLDDLMKVKVRNFSLKGDETKQIGVVAQELEEVFPSMINETKGSNPEDETLYKGVKYSVFVPILIKAIQELKAEIEILKNK